MLDYTRSEERRDRVRALSFLTLSFWAKVQGPGWSHFSVPAWGAAAIINMSLKMADSACERQPGGRIHHLSSSSSSQCVCVNGAKGWQCNFWLLVLKKVITWACKALFCCYIFRSWQLLRYERADIIFMVPVLFHTDTSHILINYKVHYSDVVLRHIISV